MEQPTLVSLGDVATVSQGLSTSGHGAGAKPGPWEVSAVGVGDIRDDRLDLGQLGTLRIERNARTEKHLLLPEDVLVTARSTVVKAALVPPALSLRAVADATLLVVRPRAPGVGPYLWWYLTSAIGRERVRARMLGSTTLLFLSASSLAEVEFPLPAPRRLDRLDDLIAASERAYAAALAAARLRREAFRDAIVAQLGQTAPEGGAGGPHPPPAPSDEGGRACP